MNTWHKKGLSKNIALCALFGILHTPFNVFNSDLRCSRMTPCSGDQQTWAPERARDNNMHIMVTPESLMGLHLNELLKMVIEDALHNNCLHELPPGVVTCYEQLENGAQALHVQDLAQALPTVVEKLTQMMKSRTDKAPRPDAPGNTDGAPVGSLLECDLTPVLQAIQKLANLVNNNGCNEIIVDIDGTFTVLNDVLNTLTECCTELQVDFDGTFTVLDILLSSTCCDVIGLMTDNPPGSTTDPYSQLPTSTDTYLTTTFNVIEWLKAIYIRLGQHAGY